MTQHMESEHDRPSIEVSAECPTIAIRHRLEHLHVGTPASEIEELIREAVKGRRKKGIAAWTAEREEEAVEFALWQHAENMALYVYVMSGRVTAGEGARA